MNVRLLLFLSSVMIFIGCGEGNPSKEPVLDPDFTTEMLDPDFSTASIDNLSKPSEEGLRTITMSFRNGSKTSLMMKAKSAFKHLEAGYYDIQELADERLEAVVALKYDGAPVEIESGSVYVRNRNDKYYLKWSLQTAYGEVICTANCELPFERDEFEKLLSGGTCEIRRNLTLESRHMNETMKYTVCLPEGYDPNKEYPVLYMLHGMDGNNNDWLNDGLDGGVMHAYASDFFKEGGREMIIVSPSVGNTFYADGYVEGKNCMSYFFEEFIPHIETTWPVRPERGWRAIGGLSMGGYGALYFGLLHPEMFSCIYACSAATSGGPKTPSLRQFMSIAMNGGKTRDLPEITMEIGTEDTLCFGSNEQFVGVLDEYNISYEYITRPGVHYWSFWNVCSPKIIRKAAAVFEK